MSERVGDLVNRGEGHLGLRLIYVVVDCECGCLLHIILEPYNSVLVNLLRSFTYFYKAFSHNNILLPKHQILTNAPFPSMPRFALFRHRICRVHSVKNNTQKQLTKPVLTKATPGDQHDRARILFGVTLRPSCRASSFGSHPKVPYSSVLSIPCPSYRQNIARARSI